MDETSVKKFSAKNLYKKVSDMKILGGEVHARVSKLSWAILEIRIFVFILSVNSLSPCLSLTNHAAQSATNSELWENFWVY